MFHAMDTNDDDKVTLEEMKNWAFETRAFHNFMYKFAN